MSIRIGTSGLPENYKSEGHTSTFEMPRWLRERGLDAFEYQCGRGVMVSTDGASTLGDNAKTHGVVLSLHSPYFVNIATDDPEVAEKSVAHLMKSATAAHHMGARRIVVHMGACGKQTRVAALDNAKRFIQDMLRRYDEAGWGDIALCPETMGKLGQLGTLEETVALCATDERLIPTLDFGHLYARMGGDALQRVASEGKRTSTSTSASTSKPVLAKTIDVPPPVLDDAYFEHVYAYLLKHLGAYRAKNFHCHFSRIAYTKGGEKHHVTFADPTWGPDFAPFARVIAKYDLSPHIVCESDGTQDVDAMEMRRLLTGAVDSVET